MQEYWAEKKLAATLFKNVKRAFDYISKTKLVKKIIKLDIDKDII